MTDAIHVTFIDKNDDTVFNANMDCAPRIGETVNFSFSATDQPEWNEEAWEKEREMDGKEWTVVKVQHEFRRYRINSMPHHIFVTLKAVDGK